MGAAANTARCGRRVEVLARAEAVVSGKGVHKRHAFLGRLKLSHLEIHAENTGVDGRFSLAILAVGECNFRMLDLEESSCAVVLLVLLLNLRNEADSHGLDGLRG